MSLAQITIEATAIQTERIGHQAVSLTHFDDLLEPKISAGSVVEIAGALFEAGADEAGTGWAGIANSSAVYLKLVVTGATAALVFTTTAPTWSTSKQGWYASLDRYIGGLYKDSGGNYSAKWLYEDKQIDSIKRYGDGAVAIGVVAIGGSLQLSISSDIFYSGTIAAGGNVNLAADAAQQETSTSYVKHKEILCPFSGIVTIDFALKSNIGTQSAYGRIYKNGSPVGTERSTASTSFVTFSEDISIAEGDLIQLYLKSQAGTSFAQNFRIKSSSILSAILGRILQVAMIIMN